MKKEILFYAADRVSDANLLGDALKSVGMGLNVDRYSSIDCFTNGLLQAASSKKIAVIYAASEKDLIDLYFIKHVMRTVEVILLLPDTERHTIALGHCLHPSFMCTTNTDVFHVAKVVRNIAVNGTVPQPSEQFRNPFESLMPESLIQLHGHLNAAA